MLNEKITSRKTIIFVLCFLVFPLILLAYAAHFDWSLFWQVQKIQAARPIGPQGLLNLLLNPVIVNKIVPDGWYFLGFFALFYSFFDYKNNKIVIIPSLLYFILLLVSLTKEGSSGWYAIPLFPFMAIAIARMVSQSEKLNFGLFPMLFFIGMWEIQQLYEAPFGLTSTVFRILSFFLFIPILFALLRENKRLFSFMSYFYFYAFILGNVLITISYVHPS